MRIGFLSLKGISDPRISSGTPFFLAKLLREEFGEVIDLSPDTDLPNSLVGQMFDNPIYTVERLGYKLLGKEISHLFNRVYQRRWAEEIENNIRIAQPDWIFADKCSFYFTYLKSDVPIIYRSDSTFSLMDGYYPEFSSLLKKVKRSFEYAEVSALSKCRYFIPLSNWAARSAINDYKLRQDACQVLRSHASLAHEDVGQPKSLPEATSTLKFLFVGANWNRKGGDLVVDTLRQLSGLGYSVRLSVLCKSVPKSTLDKHSFIRSLEFIDRSSETGNQEYIKLFRENHFFFLPTQAECLGQVFIDAIMNGLPSIALDTGAVSEVVMDQKTGLLFQLDANSLEIAKGIDTVLKNPEIYRVMSYNALKLYSDNFSKMIFIKKMKGLIQRLGHRV